MNTTTITIKGMHCQSCEALLTDVLSDTPGVKNTKVSIATGKATIEYDPKQVDEKKLRQAIEAEGYTTA